MSKEEQFAEFYSNCQQRLFGFVMGLVRDNSDAQDVLQQTAITAWNKFDEFDPDTDFMRWIVTIARYTTQNFLRKKRNSHLYFDHTLMEQLSQVSCEVSAAESEDRVTALSECLKKLGRADKRLIESRYTYGLSSRQLAEVFERPQTSVCNSLRRVRKALLDCVSRRLATDQ